MYHFLTILLLIRLNTAEIAFFDKPANQLTDMSKNSESHNVGLDQPLVRSYGYLDKISPVKYRN